MLLTDKDKVMAVLISLHNQYESERSNDSMIRSDDDHEYERWRWNEAGEKAAATQATSMVSNPGCTCSIEEYLVLYLTISWLSSYER